MWLNIYRCQYIFVSTKSMADSRKQTLNNKIVSDSHTRMYFHVNILNPFCCQYDAPLKHCQQMTVFEKIFWLNFSNGMTKDISQGDSSILERLYMNFRVINVSYVICTRNDVTYSAKSLNVNSIYLQTEYVWYVMFVASNFGTPFTRVTKLDALKMSLSHKRFLEWRLTLKIFKIFNAGINNS